MDCLLGHLYASNYYGIFEYNELKKLLSASHTLANQKITAEQELSGLAAKVAHDIRSPLSVIEIVFRSIMSKISQDEVIILRDALQSVRDIANNVLTHYRQSDTNNVNIKKDTFADDGNIERLIPLFSLVELAASLKRQEWVDYPCELIVDTDINSKCTTIYAAPNEIKRMLSNLLNNAYDALTNENRKIYLKTELINDQIILYIQDTGRGISANLHESVLIGLSSKHKGKGLGLSNAKTYMESLGGNLLLTSKTNNGTVLTLQFPKAKS